MTWTRQQRHKNRPKKRLDVPPNVAYIHLSRRVQWLIPRAKPLEEAGGGWDSVGKTFDPSWEDWDYVGD